MEQQPRRAPERTKSKQKQNQVRSHSIGILEILVSQRKSWTLDSGR